MRKVRKFVFITFAAFLLIITFSYVNHQVQLSKENERFIPNGMLTEVNDYQMHVYSEGTGNDTLVFLSGSGTSSPVLDFKSLYTLLSDTYQIAVVERAGYGFSEVSDSERDLDTMLSETRKALFQSGVKGPFILVPHSMSGIEALHWAQTYPEEVKAIIGLDMAVPAIYEQMNINMTFLRMGKLAADIGVTRWIPALAESDAITYGTLTEEEKELYKVIFYRRTATKNMLNETAQIKDNAKLVQEHLPVNVPILLFSSNGQGTGWNENEWVGFQQEFIAGQESGDLVELDCSHYVHDIEYKQIAEESVQFIKKL
ncbi:alpha/beta fold hydrolase [Sporosarcina obsidiansis]|uniref:alpha/beta fold hydrolase n=1 Tax=Sporosarcina obsidiansis TaxID=2660748 RepID=UPI001891C066|nr:alpha/beta hydrolase [Sporosarcina obsidiansis]